MNRKWTYPLLALIAAVAAVFFAFMAGKGWDEEPGDLDDQDETEEPDVKEPG